MTSRFGVFPVLTGMSTDDDDDVWLDEIDALVGSMTDEQVAERLCALLGVVALQDLLSGAGRSCCDGIRCPVGPGRPGGSAAGPAAVDDGGGADAAGGEQAEQGEGGDDPPFGR